MAATLAQVLELTDRVQRAIDEGDWFAAQDLEKARLAALEQLVAERGTGGDMARSLAELHERNQKMIGEVHHHRRRVLRDASLVKTGQAAAAAYGASPAKAGGR
jgi:hypothetical protein